VSPVRRFRPFPARRPSIGVHQIGGGSVITAPIVGATKLHHLDDATASVDVKLSAEEVAALEAPYIPHAVVGFE
jgi:aryl-alcohol dehydrogenase-like predicted oxidoreductase